MTSKYLVLPVRSMAIAALGCGSLAGAAQAAALSVHATDLAGHPLADAIVLVEPAGAKVPVKPMPDAQISQIKRQFDPRVLLITVGTKVSFPNFDTVRHHVYSFSPTKTFELKLYAGVPNAPVTFDKPGIAVLGCNIHDNMAAWVVVADTPWFGRSGANGVARVENVPAGDYKVRVWHAALPPNTEPVSSAASVGTADLEQTVKLAVVAP